MTFYSDFVAHSVPVYVTPKTRLSDALDAMSAGRVDTVWVIHGGQKCGELREDDVLQHVSQNGGLSKLRVSMLMRRID